MEIPRGRGSQKLSKIFEQKYEANPKFPEEFEEEAQQLDTSPTIKCQPPHNLQIKIIPVK